MKLEILSTTKICGFRWGVGFFFRTFLSIILSIIAVFLFSNFFFFFFCSFGEKEHKGPGEQDCFSPFDGLGEVLAHGITPPDGRIHFDEAEKWTEKGSRFWSKTESLYQVATHEIGHALGLGHSTDADAVMWPFSKKGKPKLAKDDIAGIRKLYGRWLKPRNDVT